MDMALAPRAVNASHLLGWAIDVDDDRPTTALGSRRSVTSDGAGSTLLPDGQQ
jgi:hypothetical protein